MSLKLDMSKAYDHVEWFFLETIMRKMGFGEISINMVTQCVKVVSFSIMINGEPKENIKPMKGLRQRDSLSPYLFLLC